MSAARVMGYDDGAMLVGAASAQLIAESAAAEPTGAVPAYLDEAGVWQYVAPSQAAHYETHLHTPITTVYVEPARIGGTQPEAERKRQSRGIRLSAEAWQSLEALATTSGETRSAVVERLVLKATRRRARR
jgi:hypothetical protein